RGHGPAGVPGAGGAARAARSRPRDARAQGWLLVRAALGLGPEPPAAPARSARPRLPALSLERAPGPADPLRAAGARRRGPPGAPRACAPPAVAGARRRPAGTRPPRVAGGLADGECTRPLAG